MTLVNGRSGTPYIGSQKIKYLFIDGGALDSLLQNLSNNLLGGMQIEIDYPKLANGHDKVFYYDCIPAQKGNEKEADYQNRKESKIKLFNHLSSLDRFHVYEGTARYRNKLRGQEQKQVDIMIAVDMLTHSFRRNMHEATLLTGDLDFKPLIDALVQEGMFVSLWYPKGRTNYELVEAADSRKAISIDIVISWLTKTCKAQAQTRLPEMLGRKSSIANLNSGTLENTVEKSIYKAYFYKTAGEYVAAIPGSDHLFTEYSHDNLEQLEFYVEQLHGADVNR